jgi:hypothetical protein
MNKLIHTAIVILGISFIFSSCKKDKVEPTNVPKIEFVSISPSTVVEYQDSINIVISYDDYDGDIGANDANVKNLFVTDSRNNVTYEYRISQLSPSGSTIHIKGNLNAIIKNTAITNGSTSQSVSYSVYLKDRAGNQSNVISTSAITITQ